MTWPKPPRRSKSGRPCSQPDKAARACAVISGSALGLGARAPKRGAKAALPSLRREAKPHRTCDGRAKPAVGGDGALAFFRERKSKAHRSRPDRRSIHQAEPKTEANSAGIKQPSAQFPLRPIAMLAGARNTVYFRVFIWEPACFARLFCFRAGARRADSRSAGAQCLALERGASRARSELAPMPAWMGLRHDCVMNLAAAPGPAGRGTRGPRQSARSR